jgi:hypothetical protein
MTRLPSNGELISVLHPALSATASNVPNGTLETTALRALGGVAGCAGEEPPPGFTWQQEPHHILEVCNHWRVHARWWEGAQAVWREYFKVTTDSGLLCLIYHDLQSDNWYLSRIYD